MQMKWMPIDANGCKWIASGMDANDAAKSN
jgi:hypothetical protein